MYEGDMNPALDHSGTSLPMAYMPLVFMGTTPQSLWPHFSNCLCQAVPCCENADSLAQPPVSGEWQNMPFFFLNLLPWGGSNMP